MKVFFSLLLIAFFSLSASAQADESSQLILQSPSFKNQGILPKLYTCDGKDINPALSWSGVPSNAKSLVLILSDIDAPSGTFYHWVLYNIPTTKTAFPENMDTIPRGAGLAKNSWGKIQYNGPCPPKGSTHYYVFTLYALDTKLSLPSSADGNVVLDVMQKHILDKIELSASYGRTR